MGDFSDQKKYARYYECRGQNCAIQCNKRLAYRTPTPTPTHAPTAPRTTCSWAEGDESDNRNSYHGRRTNSQQCLSRLKTTSSVKPTPAGKRCNHWAGTQCCFYETGTVLTGRNACAKRCQAFSDVSYIYYNSTGGVCMCKMAGPNLKGTGPNGWHYAATSSCK